MINKFFKGSDYQQTGFKPLIPKYYPREYRRYIDLEEKLIKSVTKDKKVLEAGVGIGRLIPIIAPKAKQVVGVDNSSFMVQQSKLATTRFLNVKIFKLNLENLSKKFPVGYFDTSLCVWNTLGM